jgi:hypothetical protein
MVLQPHSHVFRVFDSCGNLVCDFSQWLTHLVVIAFLIAWTLMSPIWDFTLLMDPLTPFSCGLRWVRGHASRASFVGPWLYPCDASIDSSHVVPFRDSHHFSNDCLILFLELIFWHVSKGDSKTSFSNQILHVVNPHDKLSTFVLYPSLGFLSIYRLTLWDPRLRHLSLSCHM